MIGAVCSFEGYHWTTEPHSCEVSVLPLLKAHIHTRIDRQTDRQTRTHTHIHTHTYTHTHMRTQVAMYMYIQVFINITQLADGDHDCDVCNNNLLHASVSNLKYSQMTGFARSDWLKVT